MKDHPIAPPPHELVSKWEDKYNLHMPEWVLRHVATEAARWGADQELEACIDVLSGQYEWDLVSNCISWKEFRDLAEEVLRAARRPKPPSLKEQALAIVENLGICDHLNPKDQEIIRRALEQLND